MNFFTTGVLFFGKFISLLFYHFPFYVWQGRKVELKGHANAYNVSLCRKLVFALAFLAARTMRLMNPVEFSTLSTPVF